MPPSGAAFDEKGRVGRPRPAAHIRTLSAMGHYALFLSFMPE